MTHPTYSVWPFSAREMGVSIRVMTSVILGLVIIGILIDRRHGKATESLRAREAWADAILNTITDGILSMLGQNALASKY